jgi:folylpolyglutamate synthase/dihydropteroate synthase
MSECVCVVVMQGSTSCKLAEGLRYSGLRTGLCTGPHISSFRERMQVNGELVSEGEVVVSVEKMGAICVYCARMYFLSSCCDVIKHCTLVSCTAA